ncbi:MAG: 50S ribosomal protein L34e [Nanoarchaeota archaeon]|nr:50S ribosomal protein L34e [Nanoarchaeota archaeon]MBU4300937.1 50S ribosomal protein L34e [Nanoarchaeota archaeon]MBU4451933.1 50S ribosomal protein L34e [Nanoarchaeota archaeon]MCG2723412.1 50S ribosomal protein L34e [archaeon]
MTSPRNNTKSAIWKKIRVPSGVSRLHIKRKKVNAAHCAVCKTELSGVPSKRSYEMRKLSKTEKRPERMYGGVLCGNCVKEKLKASIRAK